MRSADLSPLLKLSLVGVGVLLVFGGFSSATVSGQQAANPYPNWPAPAYDDQNTNYDPQNTINASNVASLQTKWIYQVPVNPYSIPGAPPALGIETQPIVQRGIVYVATPYNRLVALNTQTGAIVWEYQVNMTKFIGEQWWAGAYVVSSLSYYNQTVFMMASDTTIYAINAFSGTLEYTLGPIAKSIVGNTGFYYGEKAPILVGNNLLVQASTTDYGGRGFVAAYNVNTKNLSWIWYSIPPSGGDPTWDSTQCVAPQCTGNITPFPGDWGSNNLVGGGAAWGLMAVDNSTGIVYFSTGHPSDGYDASLRPGPNLFADSVVALNSTTGKMIWYYQINSHDISEGEGGWSVTLATANINGKQEKVVIQGAKNNFVYVLDAATGKLVYNPVAVGPPAVNNPNLGKTNDANMTASQALFGNNKRICPGPDGGVEMSPAVSGNTLYVATQTACGVMTAGPYPYKGQTINGYIYGDDPTSQQNSTLYAINLSNGQTTWKYEMVNRYQGSSAVVSGGVVYAIDRGGFLYEVNTQTGKLIHRISLGGVGAAGVSIAQDSIGEMMLFAPAGGGDLPNATPGVLLAFGLGASQSSSSGSTGGGQSSGLEEPIIIVLAVLVVVLAMYTLLRRRSPPR